MMNVCSGYRPMLLLAVRDALSTGGPRKMEKMAELDQEKITGFLYCYMKGWDWRAGPKLGQQGNKFFWLVSP
jgi:hypothetical protein